ncbi:PAS domain-containing sensor histidine kinase [Ferruginibacter sp.]|nr:PAS domain-containing sensor histidine kinase [Ferruginibacter sp.]
MDKRLNEINYRLSEYSKGHFDGGLEMSEKLDEVDAIMNGINMLGEDLKAITISRDYFNKIFHAVSDMVLIITPSGLIRDLNQAAEQQLDYGKGALSGQPVSVLMKGSIACFRNITRLLKKSDETVSSDSILFTKKGAAIHVRINASNFKDENKKPLILLTASDITFRVKTENLIIRAIIDTQEKERHRLAQDLHDSLSQQLSAIKFYVSSTAEVTKNKTNKDILNQSSKAMGAVIADMRNICFNLMPGTLAEFGLVKAVKEFCHYSLFCKKVNFIIKQNTVLPEMSSELKIDLYRVIQEFITNAIKHGKANRIQIAFAYSRHQLNLQLSDDGCGFDPLNAGKGMGLQNVRSRVKSHDGKLKISSIISKGTRYKIAIPVTNCWL